MQKASVLVAAGAEMDERVRECLPGHELTFVRTMVQALRELRRDGFQLLVIELNFDESRMLELLQYVRALPKYKDVPVMCVYGDNLNLTEAVIRNIDVAVKALGGMAFLDLREGSFAYQADCGKLGGLAETSASMLPPN
jgi:DNA-binding NtrC family response regulator